MRRLILVPLMLVACGGPGPIPARTPPPQAAMSGCCTHAPSLAPGSTPEPPATPVPAIELPSPIALLRPGRYFKDGFEPRVAFTVAEGWTAAQATAGFFDIQDDPGSLDVVAVQFGNVTEADSAEEAAANVAARPNLTVSDADDVKIDGVPGIHLVVDTTDPLDTDPPVFHPVIRLTPGDVSIASARRLDLTLLDVNGQVLAIMVGGSVAEWDHALELSTPVIESVQIGD